MNPFTREAGQARRRWLDEKTTNALAAAQYYLGPGVRVQQMAELLGAINPVNDLYTLQGATRRAYESKGGERSRNALEAALAAASFMAPGVGGAVANRLAQRAGGSLVDDGARAANALAETFANTSAAGRQAAGDFVADESGAFRAFHGSPHDFDKFSMDKIGTGEGAQVYGHGLYFADNEAVARSYRDALSDKQGVVDAAIKRFGSVDGAIDAMKQRISQYESGFFTDPFGLDQAQKRLAQLERQKAGQLKTGRMYEVEINANPEDFLDWDAPLSAQPERVRGAFEKASGRSQPTITPRERGGFVVEWLEDGQPKRQVVASEAQAAMLSEQVGPPKGYQSLASIAGSPQSATQQLREAGIPGIRYLDAGSRGAGDGSRNYVVFDENLINIVRKYGIAGAAAMLGMSAADVQAQVNEQGWTGARDQLRQMGLLE